MRASPLVENPRGSLSHCAAEVREHDPDRYLATLFAPADAREALFTLYAFDHEITRVRRVVSQPVAGVVRLQWWREALDAITADQPAHPVVAALYAHWNRFAPLRRRLEAAIAAREQELSSEPPADLTALEQQLAGTSGEVTLAALDLLDASEEPARAAARHLGLALGLVRLLQGLPGDLRRGCVLLPATLLAGYAIDPERLDPNAAAQALQPVIADLMERAREHLHQARRHRHAIPRRSLAALLPAPLLDAYLRRLARARCDILAPVRTRPGGSAPLSLLARYALGRY